MSTSQSSTQFPAFGNGDLAVVRVEGPGICRESGRFEMLLERLEGGGYATLVLDLSACPRVDSTFAGVLLRLATRVQKLVPGRKPLRVALCGVNGTVGELLETLCVRHRFAEVDPGGLATLKSLSVPDENLSKEGILRLSLEGHEQLASLNDANARRFAALLPMLRAELEKLEGGANPAAASSAAGNGASDNPCPSVPETAG
ncbi:MAG: STAS domain-containing protein [Verrucomicrobiales bacterium]|nr:STAS domain-containing protein [Verrucomicrobiales bacterium]